MEALACFVISKTHESYIAIAVLETCIVLFFILIYMLTIHRLMTCIHWPLLVSVHFHNSNTGFAFSCRVEPLSSSENTRAISLDKDTAELWQLGFCPSSRRETSLIPRKTPWMPLSTGQPAHIPASTSLWSWTPDTFQLVLKKILIRMYVQYGNTFLTYCLENSTCFYFSNSTLSNRL